MYDRKINLEIEIPDSNILLVSNEKNKLIKLLAIPVVYRLDTINELSMDTFRTDLSDDHIESQVSPITNIGKYGDLVLKGDISHFRDHSDLKKTHKTSE